MQAKRGRDWWWEAVAWTPAAVLLAAALLVGWRGLAGYRQLRRDYLQVAADWRDLGTSMQAAAPPALRLRARPVRVIDGDTIEVFIDRGHGDFSQRRVRLLGIDCPERDSPAGEAATKHTAEWLAAAAAGAPSKADQDWPLQLRSDRDDAFGRWLAIVEDCWGKSLADSLRAAGHVKAARETGQNEQETGL